MAPDSLTGKLERCVLRASRRHCQVAAAQVTVQGYFVQVQRFVQRLFEKPSTVNFRDYRDMTVSDAAPGQDPDSEIRVTGT
jgi:hypothetical protein